MGAFVTRSSDVFSQKIITDLELGEKSGILLSKEQVGSMPNAAVDALLVSCENFPRTESFPDNFQNSLSKNIYKSCISRSIIAIPARRTKLSRFVSLQMWEGVVTSLGNGLFTARLVDLNKIDPDHEAEIYLDEVSTDDFPLLKEGAYFYWNIGYHTTRSGQRKRESIIRFKRLFPWTEETIKASQKEAIAVANILEWK